MLSTVTALPLLPLFLLRVGWMSLTIPHDGRRALHATIQDGSGCPDSLSNFLLPVVRRFLAKSQRLDSLRLQPLVHPGLPAAEPLERTTCPVLALVTSATQSRRLRQTFADVKCSQNPLSFLRSTPGCHRPVPPPAISCWFRHAVA